MELFFMHPGLPRYSEQPFPSYRYLPFRSMPHPRNDPAGHSYDQDEEYLPRFAPEDWSTCEPYLYGVDLFNHGYWWEAHEALETIWIAAGQRDTLCGQFVQGLIQVSGAQLKRYIGEPRGAQSLTRAGVQKLGVMQGIYLGVDIATLTEDVQRCLREDRGEYPRIKLHFSGIMET